MKPFRVFLFVATVLSLIFLVSFLQSERSQEYLRERVSSSADSAILPADTNSFGCKQTPPNEYAATDSMALALAPDSIQKNNSYPSTIPNGSSLLFPPGDSIRLQKLSALLGNIANKNQQVRIFYYGDSQIESDHITSTLRKKLQQRFGGRGPGLIAPDQYYSQAHQLMVTLSDDWQVSLPKDQSLRNRSIIFRNTLAVSNNEALWFRINRLKSVAIENDYQQLRLFLYANRSSGVELINASTPVLNEKIDSTRQICKVSQYFDRTPDDLKMTFTPHDSLCLTGISLESQNGIFVDNIALRGLAYPPFSQSDRQSLLQMFGQLQPAMFILQFGVNVVPYPSADYAFFRNQFNRQLSWLRNCFPETPILVIGVSDMAHRVDGQLISYDNIHRIKQIQYEAAMSNHCLFWDLEQYMGGPGSMVRWVETIPSLARKDYVHFSERGAERIGNQLSELLLNELQSYHQTAWKNN